MVNHTQTISILNRGLRPNIHIKMCQKRKPMETHCKTQQDFIFFWMDINQRVEVNNEHIKPIILRNKINDTK
jgi:hypothetical protein